MTAKQVALDREKPFPFIILKGHLDSHDQELHLAADKKLLCSFTSSLVRATLGLLSCYYVFMFNYPAGLRTFFCPCKNVFCKFTMARSYWLLSSRLLMKLTVCQSVANCPYTVTDNSGLAGPRYDMLLNFCLLPHTEALLI